MPPQSTVMNRDEVTGDANLETLSKPPRPPRQLATKETFEMVMMLAVGGLALVGFGVYRRIHADETSELLVLALGGVVLIGSAAWLFVRERREERLCIWGVLAIGEIVDCDLKARSNQTLVTYRFRSPNGPFIEGATSFEPNAIDRPAGTRVLIAFDPANPARSTMYGLP